MVDYLKSKIHCFIKEYEGILSEYIPKYKTQNIVLEELKPYVFLENIKRNVSFIYSILDMYSSGNDMTENKLCIILSFYVSTIESSYHRNARIQIDNIAITL